MASMWRVSATEFQVRFSQKEQRKLRNGAHVTIDIAGLSQVVYAPSKNWRISKNARKPITSR